MNDNRRASLVCLVLFLVTLAIYWPVRHFDFVEYDDPDYVSENQTVQKGITTYGLMWSVVDAHAANWHPVTWISHMLDCQLFGLNPGAHHMVNVLFHCANSVLLFLLLRNMTGAFWHSAFVAALFAWHPLRVESVAWISERKDVLSGFFFMLTLLAYNRYTVLGTVLVTQGVPETPEESDVPDFGFSFLKSDLGDWIRAAVNSSCFFYRLSTVLFACGLLAKPMLVTVPFVLLLLDFWPLGRYTPNGARNLCPPWRNLFLEKVPFFLLSLIVGFVTVFAQRSGGAVISLRSEDVSSRLGNLCTGYLTYLEKVLWPQELTFLYLRPPTQPLFLVFIAAIVVVLITGSVLIKARRRPYLAVGWLWFVVMVLPVSGLIQTGLQATADRYTYLPSIGLGVMAVWGLAEFAGRCAYKPIRRIALPAGGGLALLICSAISICQLSVWQNTETLMQHALKINPNNYVAHQDLGVYYSKKGLDQAAREHRQAAR